MFQNVCDFAYASKTTRDSATPNFRKFEANIMNSMQATSQLCLMNTCTKGAHTWDKQLMLQCQVWQQVNSREIASIGEQIALKAQRFLSKGHLFYLFTQAGSSEVSLHSSVVRQHCLQPPLVVTLLGRLLVGAILQLLQAPLKLLQLAFKSILLLAQFVHLQTQLATLALRAKNADSPKLDFSNLIFPVDCE